MNNRQKTGVGMLVSGLISLLLGIVVTQTGVTPPWVDLALQVFSVAAPAFGLVINLPSNTDPR